MKYAFVLTTMAATFCSAASIVQAQPAGSNYVQMNLGSGLGGNVHVSASDPTVGSGSADVGVHPGIFASAAVGHTLPDGFAVEGEAYYAHNSGKTENSAGTSSAVSSYGGLANLMYAIGQVSGVVPYVGGGVGYGHSEIEVFGGSVGASGLVWQLRAGISGDISPTAKWDLGYRYFSEPRFDETDAGEHLKIEPHIHVLTIGMRQRF